MKHFIIGFLLVLTGIATAVPLDTWPAWTTSDPFIAQQIPARALVARGIGTSAYYVLEVDPATGEIPVSATVDLGDTNYGTVGVDTQRTAAQIGNATGAADFGSGVVGAQTLRVTVATDDTVTVDAVDLDIRDLSSGTDSVSSVITSQVAHTGRSYADSVRNDYSSVNVTTGAWVQLIASTAADINELTLFDSSGQTLELGVGAAASESRVLLVPPGGIDGTVPLRIPSGTRLAIRAVSATANAGEITITGLN